MVALALLPFLAGGGFVLGGQLFADPAPTASAVSSAHTTDAPHVLPSTAPTAAAPVAPAAPAPVAPAAPAPVAPAAPAPVAPAPAPAPVAVTSGAPVPAAGPAASFGRGASGEDVRRWQVRMAERGWAITVDGVFGAESAAVARRFQAEKGLAVDGVVGPRTWAAAWDLPVTPS